MNTIIFELCAEDRARLDRIIGALENHQNCEHCVSAAITMTKAAQAETETPTVTREDVRGKVVKLCAAGKKEDVKKVVTAYAEAVKDIPEDKLAEVFEKLTALEG